MPHLSMSSPLGPLTVFEDGGAVVALEWGRADGGSSSAVLKKAKAQLDAYFDGKLKRFDLPLVPTGTDFQRKVWGQLSKIPFGKIRSYGDIAEAVSSAPRAVGGACGRNPIPIIIPCHRVLGQNGALTGYSGGDGIGTKEALLRLEGYAAL
ncbi:MAG: methylated-DNA--[protein]-cysteine S-methyltransferase [Rhodospirillales bacterium]|nr:methylated-DNA--[protein]-cysteine S-methyltransferase [Rhodospirillales bacterium]